MTQDELMFIAREAGFGEPINHNDWHLPFSAVKAFAKLVAAKERDRMCKQCNWSKHENATCNEANQPKILGES